MLGIPEENTEQYKRETEVIDASDASDASDGFVVVLGLEEQGQEQEAVSTEEVVRTTPPNAPASIAQAGGNFGASQSNNATNELTTQTTVTSAIADEPANNDDPARMTYFWGVSKMLRGPAMLAAGMLAITGATAYVVAEGAAGSVKKCLRCC